MKGASAKHAGLVRHLAQFDDFESKIDKAMEHPDFRLCSPETVKAYREILVREIIRARGQ